MDKKKVQIEKIKPSETCHEKRQVINDIEVNRAFKGRNSGHHF